eukprot:jgi/Phyca11/129715/e_gw1.86.136.1
MTTTVRPFTAAASGPSRSTIASTTRSLRSNLKRAWLSTQVSHRGKYSIERFLALEEYTRTTSLVHVLFVCIGTPLPLVIVVVLQENLPLENPTDGWRANWGFWIRVAVLGGVTSLGIFSQLERMVGINLSRRQLVVQFVFVAICYTATSILISSVSVFPIPFMTLVTIPAFMIILIGSVLVILGP